MPQIAPFRCRAYDSVPLAHLQSRTYYNASWKAEASSLTARPQSPAPNRHPQKRGPEQTQARRHSITTTTPLQIPAISSRPHMIPRGQPGVSHLGLQDGPKQQGELKTKLFKGQSGWVFLCLCANVVLPLWFYCCCHCCCYYYYYYFGVLRQSLSK